MPALSGDRLADILRSRRFLDESTLQNLLAQATSGGIPFEEILLDEGVFSREQLLEILENYHFCRSIDVRGVAFDPAVLVLLPRQIADRCNALPVDFEEDGLRVAFADPDDQGARETVARATRREIRPLAALGCDLAVVREEYYSHLRQDAADDSSAPAADRPARQFVRRRECDRVRWIDGETLAAKEPVEIVDAIIGHAVGRGATDIHFEPDEDRFAIRIRLDGVLHGAAELPRELGPAIVSRLKVLGRMDIAEHRLPQDGRHSLSLDSMAMDLRISALPSQYGEKVVLRLLHKDLGLLDLEKLRLPALVREAYEDVIANPQGFFLVSGPTGSGKTTTLYATLCALDRESLNIVTLEDPIEYSLPGITQVQIHEEIGLSFAAGLRSFLRQDPDVILVGEMRDLETVEVACRAALTGHKVLSTIHTNDACQVITRLLDMGTPAHLIAATLRGVLAQRLVRTLCPHCRVEYSPSETELAVLGYPESTALHRGEGCERCSGTGYLGRMGIFEYFKLDESIHRLILDRASPYALRYAAQRNGMVAMADFAKRAVLAGHTTVAEIQRSILAEEPRERLCVSCQRVVNADFSVCPFCQAKLHDDCPGCGKAVESSWENCPNCGGHLEREWQKVYCRHCLAPVQANWSSCQYCGGEL